MGLGNIHIAKSALTDQVYAGYVNKDGVTWRQKHDVTNDFLGAVVARFAGYETVVTSSNGKRYSVVMRELPSETGKPLVAHRIEG